MSPSTLVPEDVGVLGAGGGPIALMAEPDDHVAESLHRFLPGCVSRLALGVVVVRSVYVDGGAVVAVVEEIGAGAGLREEALGVRGEPMAMVFDEGEPLLLQRGAGLA